MFRDPSQFHLVALPSPEEMLSSVMFNLGCQLD